MNILRFRTDTMFMTSGPVHHPLGRIMHKTAHPQRTFTSHPCPIHKFLLKPKTSWPTSFKLLPKPPKFLKHFKMPFATIRHQPMYISRWPSPAPQNAQECKMLGRQSRFLEDLEEAPWPTGLLRPTEQELADLKARRRPSLSSSLRSVKSFLGRMKFWRRKSVEDWGA